METMQYELVEVHELPMVNAKRSVKKALLSDAGVKRYNSLKHKVNHLSIFLYILAFPIGAAVLTVDAEYGRILCVFKFSLQIPMLLFVTAGLRVDILRILLSTYEFWFFTTLNALACILFAINFGDQRIFMAPVYWYGIQLCVCADAKIQDSRVGAAAVLATLYHVFLLVVFGLELTPEAHPFALFHKNNRTMSSTDFLMNSFTTMMMLLARTAYRNKALQRRHRTDAVVVRLTSYRCRVKLREVPEQCLTRYQSLRTGLVGRLDQSLHSLEALSRRQRLHLVKPRCAFHVRNIVWPGYLAVVKATSPWKLILFYFVGGVGFALNLAVLASVIYLGRSSSKSETLLTLMVVALACSLIFCGAFVGLYQRRLLLRLASSFDFMFITLQITCAYLSIFDMFYWDSRCLTIFTGWVWLVWLLTLDALTPKVRALMKFKNWYAAPVLLFSISVQIFITGQVVNSTSIDIQDRVLWNPSLYGYSAEFRAVPFFLSRVATLLLWSLRILWRLLTSGKDDLIMIQGSVEFFGASKRRQAPAFQSPCCRRSSPVCGPPTRILPHPS